MVSTRVNSMHVFAYDGDDDDSKYDDRNEYDSRRQYDSGDN